MQLIWIDDSFPKKDRSSSFHLDSSRTSDSISNISNHDEISPKKIGRTTNFNNSNNKKYFKSKEITNLISDLKPSKKTNKFFNLTFRKRLSFALCAFYLILFLMCLPKKLVKVGEEENIDILIRNDSNTNINILINHFNFFDSFQNKKQDDEFTEYDGNLEINSINKKTTKKYNQETSGFLLKSETNKTFIFRWIMGFIYIITKCIVFIYSNNGDNNNLFLDKSKVNIIQKVSMIFFPVLLFLLDLQNNIVYSEIKTEHIMNKCIIFYIMNTKKFSMIDYVEGLFPILFYFVLSIDFNSYENVINNYIIKRQKQTKLK